MATQRRKFAKTGDKFINELLDDNNNDGCDNLINNERLINNGHLNGSLKIHTNGHIQVKKKEKKLNMALDNKKKIGAHPRPVHLFCLHSFVFNSMQ